jgi:predicted aldo/keto reductase-like oxidoreductase
MTFLLILQIAIMNKTETLQVEMPFSFAEIKPFTVSTTQNKVTQLEKRAVTSINNYLKTPEEIDAELCLEMSNRKTAFAEHKDIMDSYGRIFKNRSDNAYSPDNNPSGFMEENY